MKDPALSRRRADRRHRTAKKLRAWDRITWATDTWNRTELWSAHTPLQWWHNRPHFTRDILRNACLDAARREFGQGHICGWSCQCCDGRESRQSQQSLDQMREDLIDAEVA